VATLFETITQFILVAGDRAVVQCPDGFYAIAITMGGTEGPIPCTHRGPFETAADAMAALPDVPTPPAEPPAPYLPEPDSTA